MKHSKAYTEQLQDEAMKITRLGENGEVVDFRETAVRLMDATGCTYATARKHIAHAARRQVDDTYDPPEWGGYRPGAGQPFDYIIDVVNCRAIVSQRVTGQWGLLEYSAAVNWEELEEDAATAVAAQGSGINISGQYPCPPELVARAVWDTEED